MATRRERVVLDLEDNFTSGMAKAAVATALLDKALDRLDGSSVKSGGSLRSVGSDAEQVEQKMRKSGVEIDRFSGRLRLIGEAVAVLGPGLVPLGAVAIPAVTGLASQLGFAAVAGGTVIAAFQGIGDALKAVNNAALEPTTANLEKARLAMEDLSPAAQDFVGRLRDFVPALKQIRDSAAEGLFPGVSEALDSLEEAGPRVAVVAGKIASALGDIAADAGASIASDRWSEFIDYLGTDGPQALSEMASAVGNVTHAMAELWMAFDPLNDDFSGWLVKATADLDKWAQGLDQTQGFQDFVDYIRTVGPQVSDTLGALGNALVDIVTAAAPLGTTVLKGLEGVFKLISAIAGSDLGTPIMAGVAALALYSRGMAVLAATSARMQASGGPLAAFASDRKGAASAAIKGAKADIADLAATWATAGARTEREAARVAKSTASLKSNLGSLAKEGARVAGPVAAIGVLSTGAAEGIGLQNTATLALAGTIAGPWGAALGGAAGLLLDTRAAAEDTANAFERLDSAMRSGNLDAIAGSLREAKGELESMRGFSLKDVLGNIDFKLFNFGDKQAELDKYAASVARAQSMLNSSGPLAAAGSIANIGKELGNVASGADGAANSVRGFATAVALANNALTAQGTVDAYRASLFALEDALAKNGAGLSQFTRKGLENRNALRGVASSALEAAQNMSNVGQRNNFLDRAREDFIGVAMAAGATRRQAANLATQFGLLDTIKARPKVEEMGSKQSQARVNALRREIRDTKSKMVNMDEKGAAAARARIAALRSEINSLRDRTITITTNQITNRITRLATQVIPFGGDNARGGIWQNNVRAFAQGGFGDVANRHQPELAGPGMTRIWREPETQGEAYIPLANDDRRPRAQAIAAETVALLGGVATFGQGGSVYDKATQVQAASSWASRSGGATVISLKGATLAVDMGDLGTVFGEVVDERMGAADEISGMLERAGQ